MILSWTQIMDCPDFTYHSLNLIMCIMWNLCWSPWLTYVQTIVITSSARNCSTEILQNLATHMISIQVTSNMRVKPMKAYKHKQRSPQARVQAKIHACWYHSCHSLSILASSLTHLCCRCVCVCVCFSGSVLVPTCVLCSFLYLAWVYLPWAQF